MSTWRKKPRRQKAPRRQALKQLEAWLGDFRSSQFFDGIGYRLFSVQASARAILQQALLDDGEHEAAKQLKGAKLEQIATRQVDQALRQGHCDLTLRCITKAKAPGEIRIQVEITGYDDPSIAIRSTGYWAQGALQEAESKKKSARTRSLTPAASFVVNIGPRLLQAPCAVEDMFLDYGAFKKLKPRHWTLRFDIMAKTLDEILALGDRRAASILGMLRIAHESRKYGREDIVRVIKLAAGNRERERMVALCIAYRLQGVYYEWALQALEEEGIGRETVAGMVEIVARKAKAEGRVEGKAEGVAEGKAEGVAEGKAETLLSLVRRKFRRIPKWREAQVRSAKLEQLEDWVDRVLDAPDINSLFGESGRAKRQPQG